MTKECDEVANKLRALLAAPQAAPAPCPKLGRHLIRSIFMQHGFTIKDGQTDLKSYVYEAAEALLAEFSAPAPQALTDADRLDAERWRFAMDWGQKDFAVCKRVGKTGACWEPIKTDGPIDAARAASAGGQ